jgi:hypothetical protein
VATLLQWCSAGKQKLVSDSATLHNTEDAALTVRKMALHMCRRYIYVSETVCARW